MTDDEIRQSWAEFYPRWRTDRAALIICRALCDAVIHRARASTIIGSEDSTITHLCFESGIPKSEFEEVRNFEKTAKRGGSSKARLVN